jgi:hypothetical protein
MWEEGAFLSKYRNANHEKSTIILSLLAEWNPPSSNMNISVLLVLCEAGDTCIQWYNFKGGRVPPL